MTMADCFTTRLGSAIAALALIATSFPAAANVREGVEAWSRGEYEAAVAQWEGPAQAGDPDAMFNLGQAYRLGRGVSMDLAQAEQLYRDAAEAGHMQAADTYGLMLFQDGRREEALPFVQAAAGRGDPRARYLLGIALFNGDIVERDWERAYALMTLANSAGLSQAGPAIVEMDTHIPLEQRQNAAALARQIEQDADQAAAVQLAAADLGAGSIGAIAVSEASRTAASATETVPSLAVSPEVAAAREAVAQARQATGTDDPAQAGASYAGAETPSAAPVAVQPAPAHQQRASGPWRVQLGAFGVPGNAQRLWDRVSRRDEVSGRERLFIPSGRVTLVQAGGYASQAEAREACSSLKRAGFECLVTRS
ncbi:SPOR domain-containing protein [Aurantiacibacter poecillastricola]|uniref:SPOR domain-containing protein n=1 Tax=Aurantiacibacter poecillastricola TaxID=3064385 RepID=UPI00273D3366|nr:SPOR domain-containing protein [Aurantiacibacter sp. 219JJ12-13]MDP5262757.1 SPOR domain-containing protein [Aurantiacibacter sp. 219JJ12-13]